MSAARLLCGVVLSLAVIVLAVQGDTGAWACVPQPLISVQPRASGPSGSDVTVEALAVSGAAEIRWNGVDGPLLATATGPSFSVPVSLPDAPPGLYAIVVFERGADGSVGSSGRAAFQITGDADQSSAVMQPAPPGPPSSPGRSSFAPAPAALALAGAGLVIAGGLGGALLSRRWGRHRNSRGS